MQKVSIEKCIKSRIRIGCQEKDFNKIEKDLLNARNQSERLMIFQINHFQEKFLNKSKDDKSLTFCLENDNSIHEAFENQREVSFHYGYLLKHLVSTHHLKIQFTDILKEKSIILFFQLWEDVDELFNLIINDVFTSQKDAFLSFQRIRQNFKNILYKFLPIFFITINFSFPSEKRNLKKK